MSVTSAKRLFQNLKESIVPADGKRAAVNTRDLGTSPGSSAASLSAPGAFLYIQSVRLLRYQPSKLKISKLIFYKSRCLTTDAGDVGFARVLFILEFKIPSPLQSIMRAS